MNILGQLAIALIIGFGGGFYTHWQFTKADRVDAVQEVRVVERDLGGISNDADLAYIGKLAKGKDDAERQLTALRARLAKTPACPVPVPDSWVRGNTDVPGTAAAPAKPESAAPSVETVADARTVVETCERNRLEVHEPNAEQIRGLQQFYESVRGRVNRGGS